MLNPIHKVLSTLKLNRVKFLLMGGQACVLYGAAEFSRDTDIALLASPDNLENLVRALKDLSAEVVAVPPFQLNFLQRGHAVHFRCHHPEAEGMRLDVMAVMRGLPSFEVLWERRTTVQLANDDIELMSLPDLVNAKKTQRDKDWPMIRRLAEAHYVSFRDEENTEKICFWLRELRTPVLLREVAERFPEFVERVADNRKFLGSLASMTDFDIEMALNKEEMVEREADRAYWKPLRKELETLRHFVG